MSDWQIKWTKDQKGRRESTKQTLFAVGTDGRDGRWEQTGLMDPDKAQFLSLFAHQLYAGKTPSEAFDEVERILVEARIDRAAAAAKSFGTA